MTKGYYGGGTFEIPFLFGLGGGLYMDSHGRIYPQLYGGTPGFSFSGGYTPNLEGLLTGPSISGSPGVGSIRPNIAGNTDTVGVGIGTPGVGVTHGFGPLEMSNDYSHPWRIPAIRDSAARAGVPSRYNVFEYGYPDPNADSSTRDAPASTQRQETSPPTPAFQPDAVYSPMGDFYGNYPRASDVAAVPSPATSSASGPGFGSQATDSNVPERRLGRKILNPSAGVPDNTRSSPAPQPQESEGPLTLNEAYLLYLARLNRNKPQASMSDSAASTASFDASNPNRPRLSAADWIASLAGVGRQNPVQPSSPQTRGLAGSAHGGNPVQPWTGAPDNSAASGNVNRNRYTPLGGPLWDGNRSRAPVTDADAPASPIDYSDSANYSGGLPGRYLALVGLDPENLTQPAPLDEEQDQANLRALDAKLSSTGDIRDAVALYNARKAFRNKMGVDLA
jgi:hypothetical protein